MKDGVHVTVFVATHQARVARDICRQDRRQSSDYPLAGQEASPEAAKPYGSQKGPTG